MKVNGTNSAAAGRVGDLSQSSASGAAKSKGKDSRTANIDSGITDKVSISSQAKDAGKAKALATAASDVDDAKVARLKAAIKNGEYKVDADQVADRLVDEHMMSIF